MLWYVVVIDDKGYSFESLLLSLISVDVNECLSVELNTCQQVCINTPGAFECECNAGFSLNSDSSTCSGMQIYFSQLQICQLV